MEFELDSLSQGAEGKTEKFGLASREQSLAQEPAREPDRGRQPEPDTPSQGAEGETEKIGWSCQDPSRDSCLVTSCQDPTRHRFMYGNLYMIFGCILAHAEERFM